MMAACQPFLSGAISKTVNLPEDATVEDVEEVYYEGWKLGLKALAIYRDNCKVGQPLSDGKAKKKDAVVEEVVAQPVRKRLPKSRPSTTTSFSVGGAEGYMTAGAYADGALGEVFLKLGKQGSTLAGVMDAFSIAVSIGLQYGVPLQTVVEKFTNLRFEPAGMTDDPDVRMAQSMMDYIFRRLALDYLPFEERAALGLYTAAERAAALDNGGEYREIAKEESVATAPPNARAVAAAPVIAPSKPVEVKIESAPAAPAVAPTIGSSSDLLDSMGIKSDAPLCMTCGVKMRASGACYVCEGCGNTSGCS
jgi:ribonucleoside-diphosphate reductase alpha chain